MQFIGGGKFRKEHNFFNEFHHVSYLQNICTKIFNKKTVCDNLIKIFLNPHSAQRSFGAKPHYLNCNSNLLKTFLKLIKNNFHSSNSTQRSSHNAIIVDCRIFQLSMLAEIKTKVLADIAIMMELRN
jgi:hypothetical protein